MKLLSIPLAAFAVMLTSACGRLAFTVANIPAAFGDVERRAGLSYGEHPLQKLDVYHPPAVDSDAIPRSRSVVIFWYGGGFTKGRRTNYRFVGDALAKQGFVVLVPDYRRHPEVRYPELLEDPARAVAWARRNAAQFGGDPQRIVLMGHSAGAYLASYLAFEGKALETAGANADDIRGVVGLSGPYALEATSKVLRKIFAAPCEPSDWQPVRYASPGDPPTLLLHGLEDRVVWPAHTRALSVALERAGVPVETLMFADRGHADTIAAFAWPARGRLPALERTTEFIWKVAAEGGSASPSLSVVPGRPYGAAHDLH